MCDGKFTGCQCAVQAQRPPLTNCVQQSPALPTLPHGASDEGDEVRDACSDVISAVCQLKDIIDVSPDDDDEVRTVRCRYVDVQSAVADLTKAVIAYMEPEDGGEPY